MESAVKTRLTSTTGSEHFTGREAAADSEKSRYDGCLEGERLIQRKRHAKARVVELGSRGARGVRDYIP